MAGSMNAAPVEFVEHSAARMRLAQREFYIDRVRVVMTALVLLHHTAITYGAMGGWFWHEIQPSRTRRFDKLHLGPQLAVLHY